MAIIVAMTDSEAQAVIEQALRLDPAHRLELAARLLDSVEEHKTLPTKLWFRKEELRDLFGPLATRLGIEVELIKKLSAIDRAKRELLKFMDRRL